MNAPPTVDLILSVSISMLINHTNDEHIDDAHSDQVYLVTEYSRGFDANQNIGFHLLRINKHL